MTEYADARQNRFHLAAQSDKMDLHARFGFKAYCEEFLDIGIPHVNMRNF